MNETGSRASGMTSRRHSTHQAAINRLRQRFSRYRKHDRHCARKHTQFLAAVRDIETQEAMKLHKRALDSCNRLMNVNGKAGKEKDVEGKVESQQQLPNGLDKSANTIRHILKEKILLEKRESKQNKNNALNSFAPSNDVGIGLGGECVSSKFQRPDGVLLPGQEGSKSISSINQPHQVDHTSVQVHKSSFGGREPSYLHDGSRIAMGSEAYAGEVRRLASTPVVSCEEPTHSNDGSESLANGLKQLSNSKFSLPGRKEYIQQELDYFDHILQRFHEEGGPPQHQTDASVPGWEDDLGQVPETQPGTHHSKSDQLKEIARLKTQRAQAQQVAPYINSQSDVNQQFPHQHAAQYSIGSTGQQAPSLLSKLSHLPSQVQQLYSQKFSSQPVVPTTQGTRLVTPLTSPDLARYSISRSQPQYQRQNSMPPLQSQAFLNSDTQYQCQVADFQEYQPRFSTPVADSSNHDDYLQRNSFPFYHRNNTQTERNLSHGMQQNLGSSQASLLRGVLPNASQNMNPPDRDSFLMNPNLNMSLSSTIQSSSVLNGRSPTTNGDLNPGIPRSQHSSVMYRNNAPVKSTSLLQEGGKFQGTSNARKGTLDGNMSVLTPTSVALGDMNERQSLLASCYAQFSGYSPLNALDKAPSFTSLLEQFAINQGNLETTYTESNQNYANLDLLGAILGKDNPGKTSLLQRNDKVHAFIC